MDGVKTNKHKIRSDFNTFLWILKENKYYIMYRLFRPGNKTIYFDDFYLFRFWKNIETRSVIITCDFNTKFEF